MESRNVESHEQTTSSFHPYETPRSAGYRSPRSRCFETWDTTDLLRAGSERLAAPQVLFFLFFYGAFGVDQDFVGH
jgi:hypothetical protein